MTFGTQVRGGGSRRWFAAVVLALAAACSPQPAKSPAAATKKPADSQHAGITTPHGDHTPHHGGIVMMNGDMHYEVVFDASGKHRVWFSDAVREELPASVATGVTMMIGRPMGPAEALQLNIDESGESWVAAGTPLDEVGTMVTLTFSVRGEPFEIEIPYVKS
jgi:hypothetical protein